MAAPTLDTMPQQLLVLELKRAIDVARNSDESTVTWETAVGRIMQLCRENPRATLRQHVLHNLGCGRRHWLRQLSTRNFTSRLSSGTAVFDADMANHIVNMTRPCGKRHHDTLDVNPAGDPAT